MKFGGKVDANHSSLGTGLLCLVYFMTCRLRLLLLLLLLLLHSTAYLHVMPTTGLILLDRRGHSSLGNPAQFAFSFTAWGIHAITEDLILIDHEE